MNNETENDLIKFIKSFDGLKEIKIVWYGGEPLLAFKRIESITTKIKKLSIPFSAIMVSNGYLFNKNIVDKLEHLKINIIQITIDGLKDTHNLRRPHINNKIDDTFSTIINNIHLITQTHKDINIHIRVNIDKRNKDEYHKIYNYINSEFKSNKIMVYPAFVEQFSEKQTCNSISCIIDNKEKGKFLIEQYKKYNIYDTRTYPKIEVGSCMARNLNGFVIGPSGEIYKCWNVVGNKDMEIGNIKNFDSINKNLLVRFLNEADYLNDINCQNCFFSPICDGGCPYQRINSKIQNKEINTCCFQKENLNDFLEIHYDNKIK